MLFLGKDSCNGDSGGPLMIQKQHRLNKYWTQIGLVSWGLNEWGGKGMPGVYTNVRHYLTWILDHLK